MKNFTNFLLVAGVFVIMGAICAVIAAEAQDVDESGEFLVADSS